MLNGYNDDKTLLADYHRLSGEKQVKVEEYIRALLRIQRAEAMAARAEEEAGLAWKEQKRARREKKDEARVAAGKSAETPYCDFCGRSADEVAKLITGPDIFICNECVMVCEEVLAEEKTKHGNNE